MSLFKFSQLLIGFFLIFLHFNLYSQSVIKGKIVDTDNLQPLTGVLISNEREQIYSDAHGLFTISNTSPLKISNLGYHSQVVEIESTQKFQFIYLTPNVQELNGIVSAFELNENLLKSTGSISLLTTKDLQQDNESNISQTLNRVAGVYMHSGTYNTNRLTIRGIGSRTPFSTNKIRAYYEEIPLTTGEGETIIEDIDMGFLQRMEVIKGPASSLYGAGLGGTILLESSSADTHKITVENHAMLGSFGLCRNHTALKSSGAQSQFYLGYSQMGSDGYRENNQYNRQSLLLATNFYPTEKTTFHFLGNYIQVKGFIPSSINQETFTNNPRAATGNWFNAVNLTDLFTQIQFESNEKCMFLVSYEIQQTTFSG